MHEQDKIDEAAYFRRGMSRVESDPTAFRYELSAFMTAARTVLDYARRAASRHRKGQEWYRKRLKDGAVLRDFKDWRDRNVHSEPVLPQQAIHVAKEEHVGIGESWQVTLLGPGGDVVTQRESPPATAPSPSPAPPATVVYRYTFPDLTGPEEIPILCDRLLNALRDVVADGQGRGLLP